MQIHFQLQQVAIKKIPKLINHKIIFLLQLILIKNNKIRCKIKMEINIIFIKIQINKNLRDNFRNNNKIKGNL